MENNVIDDLNVLIEINNDRMEGYETAKKETDDAGLTVLFSQFIRISLQCKNELVNEVYRLGGTPVEGTKTTGKLYRFWMDLKAALTGNDRKSILSACEYGEDVAVKTYYEIITNKRDDLTKEQQKMINKQFLLIKEGHDKVKELRDKEKILQD